MYGIIKTIIAFAVTLPLLFSSMAEVAIKGDKAYADKWSPEQEYTNDYATEIEKEPGKDFVILNITDTQLNDTTTLAKHGDASFELIDKLVEKTQPDLITVTGDNGSGYIAYYQFAKHLDSYGIPWAPIMGNHDGQGTPGELWCAKVYLDAENCLFKFGPANMGYGNYVINITENGKVVHTLYMMDTHGYTSDVGEEGKINGTNYDHIWLNQIEWFNWVNKGIENEAGYKPDATVFVHIPFYEYPLAWAQAYNEEAQEYNEGYADTSYGVNHEACCSPTANNGFFDVVKEGGVKEIIAGHDHKNSSSVMYNGVRLTYGLKSGFGAYYEEEMVGGTKLTVTSDGKLTSGHIYITRDDIKFPKDRSDIC